MKPSVENVLISVALLSLFLRWGPLFIGEWLQKQWWVKPISTYLPYAVLFLLVLFDLSSRFTLSAPQRLFVPLLSLLATAIVQAYFRKSIVSVIVGTFVYGFLL